MKDENLNYNKNDKKIIPVLSLNIREINEKAQNENMLLKINIETPKTERRSLKKKNSSNISLSKSPSRKLIITKSFHNSKSDMNLNGLDIDGEIDTKNNDIQ